MYFRRVISSRGKVKNTWHSGKIPRWSRKTPKHLPSNAQPIPATSSFSSKDYWQHTGTNPQSHHRTHSSQTLVVSVGHWSTWTASSRNPVVGRNRKQMRCTLCRPTREQNATVFRSFQQRYFYCLLPKLTNCQQKQPKGREECVQCDAVLALTSQLQDYTAAITRVKPLFMHNITDKKISPKTTMFSHTIKMQSVPAPQRTLLTPFIANKSRSHIFPNYRRQNHVCYFPFYSGQNHVPVIHLPQEELISRYCQSKCLKRSSICCNVL